MAKKPSVTSINLDDSFTPETTAGSVTLDDSFSAVPLDDSFTPEASAPNGPSANLLGRMPQHDSGASTKNLWSIPNQGGWGLSGETRRTLGATEEGENGLLGDVLRPLTNAPANIADVGFRGLQAVQAGLGELAVGADEIARRTGLDEALGTSGGKFLPGTAAMGVLEGVPQLGATPELGANFSVGANLSRNAQLAPDIEAGLSQMFATGSVDDIVNYAKQAGRNIDPEAVARYVAERDAGAPVSTKVQYGVDPQAVQGELNLGTPAHQTEFDFTPLDEQLANEAAAFRRSRPQEPTAEQVFARPEEQLELDLSHNIPSQREFDFDAEQPVPTQESLPLDETFTPAEPTPTPAQASPMRDRVQAQVDELTSNWKNAPEVEVVHSIDDIADPAIRAGAEADNARGSLGFYGPDGKVRIIAENIKSEADIPAILYHEALGHYGLAQKFGDELDRILRQFYDHSVGDFKAKVDDWLAKNPDEYKGDAKRVERGAEEVLARMSEAGELTPAMIDRLTNAIKRIGRRMRINLKYSDREIQTILAMAHDSVRNGKGRNVAANGFRHMYVGSKAEGHRPEDISDFYDDYARTKGENPRQLREDHGFFVGPEGGIRREIADNEAMINPKFSSMDEGSSAKLGSVLRHPELFENYPFLRDIPVTRQGYMMDWSKSMQGGYNPETGRINITPYAKDPESTLLHEIQHVIQDYEGWAEGGNAKSALMAQTPAQRQAYKRKLINEKKGGYERDLNEYNIMSDIAENPIAQDAAKAYRDVGLRLEEVRQASNGRLDFSDPATKAVYKEYQDAEANLMEVAMGVRSYNDIPKADQYAWSKYRQDIAADRLDESLARAAKDLERKYADLQKIAKAETVDELASAGAGSATEFKNYQNLFGEIEARDVQARQKLTAAERWDNLPYSSADDVASEDVILSRGLAPIAAEDSGNRYARRLAREDGEEPNIVGNTNLDNISTVNDVRKILEELAEKNPTTTKSWSETKKEARDLNLNPTKMAKGDKSVASLDAKLTAYRDVRTNLMERVGEIGTRLLDNYNEADAVEYGRKMAQLALVHAQVQGLTSDVGRALNALKIMSRSNKSASAVLEELSKSGGNLGALSNKDSLLRFARSVDDMLKAGNPEGAAAAATNILKPYWEDYILTGRHAAMLSGLGTHYKNIIENAGFIARDLQEHTVSMLGGNVTPTEVVARIYGLMRAALDSQTYRSTLEAYQKGHANRMINTKTEVEGARIPVASKVLDALNAEDVFFRNFLDSMNLYGLGVREAQKQGFRGLDAFQQGSQYALNPTDAMRTNANKLADRALLVDKPSKITSGVEALKARNLEMGAQDRAIRFAAHLVFPFARVSDRLIARKVARSPLALFSRQFWNDVKSGDKATRDLAFARAMMGTALIAYYANAANNGEIEGAGPGYKKKQSLEAGGYQPNSVIEDGKYKDASAVNVNFNPLSLDNAVATDVASLVQAYKRGQIDGEDYMKGVKNATGALMKILGSGSFAENLQPVLDAYSGATSAEENEGKSDAALGGFLGGTASSFVPTMVRTLNTSTLDTTRRDATGDKSISDRVKGRVQAGIPGLSDDLPVRYDVYGRPMEQGKQLYGVGNYQKIDTDPTVQEIQRLERTQNKPIVTPVKSSLQFEGETIKLNAEQRSEYQRVAGTYFLDSMKELTKLPGWANATDDIKKEAIKEVLTDAKKQAKEELFFTTEEDEDTNDGQ